jgi:hypothetical protein
LREEGLTGLIQVSQTAHGFVKDIPVRYDPIADTWFQSKADTIENAEVYGFVFNVKTANSFEVIYRPYTTTTNPPSLTNDVIFLQDDGTKGVNSGTIYKAIGHVLADSMILFPHMIGVNGGAPPG